MIPLSATSRTLMRILLDLRHRAVRRGFRAFKGSPTVGGAANDWPPKDR